MTISYQALTYSFSTPFIRHFYKISSAYLQVIDNWSLLRSASDVDFRDYKMLWKGWEMAPEKLWERYEKSEASEQDLVGGSATSRLRKGDFSFYVSVPPWFGTQCR